MSMFNPFDSTRRNPWEEARRFRRTDPLTSRRIGQEEESLETQEVDPRQEVTRPEIEETALGIPGQPVGLQDPASQENQERILRSGSQATNLTAQLANATAAQRAREAARSSRRSRGGRMQIVDGEGNVVDPSSLPSNAVIFAGSQEQYQAQNQMFGGAAPNQIGVFNTQTGQAMPVTQTNTAGPRGQVLSVAQGLVGSPYRLGGTTAQGIDCSGLVMVAYSRAGIDVSEHSASWQGRNIPGVITSIDNLEPGDLVAWHDGSHIAIYAGNGMIIDASRSKGTSVRPLWAPRDQVYGVRVNFPGDF